MDPSIIKLLEEDEDERMHSGVDVEAFTAALDRDISGDASFTTQPTDNGSGLLAQQNSSTWKQLSGQWENPIAEENLAEQTQKGEKKWFSEEHASHNMSIQEVSDTKNQHHQIDSVQERDQLLLNKGNSHYFQQKQQIKVTPCQFVEHNIDEQNPVDHPRGDGPKQSESQQQHKMQSLNGQQAPMPDKASNPEKQMKQAPSLPIQMFLPALCPNVDKDRSMQLEAVYNKLKNKEITAKDFFRFAKNIVGDKMLTQAAFQVIQLLATQSSCNSETTPNQFSIHNQAYPSPSSHTQQIDTSIPTFENIDQKPQGTHNKSDGKGVHAAQTSCTNINRKQHMQLTPTSLLTYGSVPNNLHGHGYPMMLSAGSGASSLKSETRESQVKETPVTRDETKRVHDASLSDLKSQLAPQQSPIAQKPPANMPKTEQKGSAFPSKGLGEKEVVSQAAQPLCKSQVTAFQGPFTLRNTIARDQNSVAQRDHVMQVSSATPPVVSQKSVIPLKKPSIGHKKPLEALGNSTSPTSKKQKTSEACLDQSIEQLNDVTYVSGVDLRKEEEQLLSAPKEDTRALEATQRVVQEEEERLILQKGLLQKKIAEITSRCGIERTSNDVEHCLSMCVEERLRGLINKLIRLSKQRVDVEKARHRCVITSDVRRQILAMNRKAKEDWEKMQAVEAEKLRKHDEGCTGMNADKDKNEGRSKNFKTNKVEDDRMRTTAANVAARAAVGGEDMLSKWQLMAEQARQKREGALVGASISQPARTASHKMFMNFEKTPKEQQVAERRVPSAAAAALSGSIRRPGRSQTVFRHFKLAHRISTRDVIAVLEGEPQMSKTSLLYHLYERPHGDSA